MTTPPLLLSQELFDETILDNQDAFDMSPEEALIETMDQFVQQLGGETVSSNSISNSNSKLNSVTSDTAETAKTAAAAGAVPASLSHLILSHPSSPQGKIDRENRSAFQNCLNLLDASVNGDGSLVEFDDHDARDNSSSINGSEESESSVCGRKVLKALELVAHRCRFGDELLVYHDDDGNASTPETTTNEEEDNDDKNGSHSTGNEAIIKSAISNNNAETSAEKETDSSNTEISNNKDNNNISNNSSVNGNGSPMPYLAIFQRTSSIYTFMSFLSIINPTTLNNTKHISKMSHEILQGTIRTLSSILSSSRNNDIHNPNDGEGKSASIRGELRDLFVPALGRIVGLLAGYYNSIIINTTSDDTSSSTITMAMADTMLIDLLRLGMDATRGCESGKVAFVQSTFPSCLSSVGGGGGAPVDDTPVQRGGVKVLVSCLSLMPPSAAATSDDISYCNATAPSISDNDNTDEEHRVNTTKILTEACHLLASLCRYDDFRDPASATSGAGPMAAAVGNVSSAHDHAMEFHRAGVLPLLTRIAKGVMTLLSSSDKDDTQNDNQGTGSNTMVANERLTAAALTALRVLAVNDEIIQTMVALGVLPIVTKALELGVTFDDDGVETGATRIRKQRLTAASLGLLRNLCGNDEIKTNLCLGSSISTHTTSKMTTSSIPSILPHLLQAMKVYPTIPLLQEHACGTLAAMALRRPCNARVIIDADGQRLVLLAMKRHEENVSVQRQGALAVRNIVSRLLMGTSSEENGGDGSAAADGNGVSDERTSIRDAFLEFGAEDVLRNIAGRHQGSVDEAYAALRDLGCTVSLMKFDAQDLEQHQHTNGHANSMGMARTMMFGEKHNSSFRPVFEESAGLEDGVDGAVSTFGA